MIAKFCLLTCVLSTGQLADRADWLLVPQLARGQELVYRGWFTEESLCPNVHFQRSYSLETNVFVVEATPRRAEVAFLTVLTLRSNRPERDTDPPAKTQPSSVRLEVMEVDQQGRLSPKPGVPLGVPLDGPPTLECGAVVEVPLTRVGPNQFWEVAEEGRPPRTWRVVGTEAVSSTTCVKLEGQQQSDDWDRPRADATAWRRRDTVWLAPQAGIVFRVERVIEQREPARNTPTQRLVVRYELDSRLTYPGKLFEDRRQEVLQARRFAEEAAPLLQQPAQYRGQIDVLLRRLAYYLENEPPTPYRKAVLQVQHRVEAAHRGEVVAGPAAPETPPTVPAITVGHRAPDFVVTDLVSKQSVRLYRLLGRPILIVFYNPTSETGKQVLRFAQNLAEKKNQGVTVLAMAVTEDAALVRRQQNEMHLPFPILDGRGLHLTFGVDATPRLILLDAEGVMRGGYTGWGTHTPREIEDELGQLLPPRAGP